MESENRVSLETLLAGYQQAYDRWMAGPRIDADPDRAFFAIFEALNWAASIDWRLAETAIMGEGWADAYTEGGVVRGFRYARNAVHHDWANALWVDRRGFILPSPLPAAFFEWCWQPRLASAREKGIGEYRIHLSGKPVRFTLEALGAVYAKAAPDSEGAP
jgi:hypothetical protein